MTNEYFSANDTLWQITEAYPETIPVFVSLGFRQMGDSARRSTFGKSVSLKTALAMKKINFDGFSSALVERIEHSKGQKQSENAVRVEGLLPCPVRIPLMEKLEAFVTQYRERYGRDIRLDLKAASMGLDWLKDVIVNEDDPGKLPDILISAGFDLFFDQRLMGKFKRRNVFADGSNFEKLNPLFDNGHIQLKDPAGHYSMIGVVPAIFLVNTEELNGRPMPETWQDILQPGFEKSISLPIGDFDLFNAILLNIHKNYGTEGVEKLGRSLMEGMHPSQMVKSHRKKDRKPAVTIMPYFFTKMVKEGGPMRAVWPGDGAVISPIFMLCKRDKMAELKPIIDFFLSVEVAEILAHKGLFPSIHPDVDNRIPPTHKFMWLGWDYIYNHDIGKLIENCIHTFNSASYIDQPRSG